MFLSSSVRTSSSHRPTSSSVVKFFNLRDILNFLSMKRVREIRNIHRIENFSHMVIKLINFQVFRERRINLDRPKLKRPWHCCCLCCCWCCDDYLRVAKWDEKASPYVPKTKFISNFFRVSLAASRYLSRRTTMNTTKKFSMGRSELNR